MTNYIEQTKISPNVGTNIGVAFRNHVEMGDFYQKSAISLEAEYGHPLNGVHVFYGLYMGNPIISKSGMYLNLNIRTGVTNGESFTITPSLQSNMKIFKRISVERGIGVRNIRPMALVGI